jgi:hypothetical protein
LAHHSTVFSAPSESTDHDGTDGLDGWTDGRRDGWMERIISSRRPLLYAIAGVVIVMFFGDMCSRAFICLVLLVSMVPSSHQCLLFI